MSNAAAIYKKLRGEDRKEPLNRLHRERFRRICGVYDSLGSKNVAKDRLEYRTLFDERRQKIDELLKYQLDYAKTPDERDLAGEKIRSDLGNFVHQLHLLLFQVISPEAIKVQLQGLEAEYSSYSGNVDECAVDIKENRALLADPQSGNKELMLRAYATHLVNDTRRLYQAKWQISDLQQVLMLKVRQKSLVLIVSFLIVVGAVHGMIQHPPLDIEKSKKLLVLAGVLSSVSISGILGAYVSVTIRIQNLKDNLNVARQLVTLNASQHAVSMAPGLGAIFSIVITFIFACGLISNGAIVPEFPKTFWPNILFNWGSMAKLMLWGFASGFSERFVPDMLDQVLAMGRKNTGTNPA